MSSEEWRPVVGYEDAYSVSSLGRVRSERNLANTKVGRILKPWAGGLGNSYLYVRLSVHDVKKFLRVHGLVAAAFLGPRPDGFHVNHKDGNRLNNAADNLEYVTRRQNEDHAMKLGLKRWKANRGRLTVEAVRAIRARPMTVPGMADRFGVSESAIYDVLRGRTWRGAA